jgi:Arc/MetJ-type ribon-helix-helix transcriptional regulator
MTIHLPKDVERSIASAVHSGLFSSADDAVAAAWRVDEQVKNKQSKSPSVPRPGTTAKRSATRKKPASIEELHRKMMARGLITRLPDPFLDIDDDDTEDQPVIMKGELLSETIIRERR